MISKKYRIYDTGPNYSFTLEELEPGQKPLPQPRYYLHKWIYKNNILMQQPPFEANHYMIYLWWNDAELAYQTLHELNQKHYREYEIDGVESNHE